MGKFLLGFALGMGLGVGLTLLLAPEPGHVNRERLRAKTDHFAAGESSPLGEVSSAVGQQRNRLEAAVEAGRQASATRQQQLWSALHLTPPDASEEA